MGYAWWADQTWKDLETRFKRGFFGPALGYDNLAQSNNAFGAMVVNIANLHIYVVHWARLLDSYCLPAQF